MRRNLVKLLCFWSAGAVLKSSIQASIGDQQLVLNESESENPCEINALTSRLKDLFDESDVDEFGSILLHDCHNTVEAGHPAYVNLFRHLINQGQEEEAGEDEDASSSDVGKSQEDLANYVDVMLEGGKCSLAIQQTWLRTPRKSSIDLLRIYWLHCKPTSKELEIFRRKYERSSEERTFLNQWHAELRNRELRWPFSADHEAKKSRSKKNSKKKKRDRKKNKLKGKKKKRMARLDDSSASSSSSSSSSASGSSSSEVETKKEVEKTSPRNRYRKDVASKPASTTSISSEPEQKPIRRSNFAHIHGWISNKGTPFARHDKKTFNSHHYSVALRDSFLAFMSTGLHIEDYLKKYKGKESFFERKNSALRMRLRKKDGYDFGTVKLIEDDEKGLQIQAIYQGRVSLIVLRKGELSSGGSTGTSSDPNEYSIVYPVDPYSSLSRQIQPFTQTILQVQPADILLLLHSDLFVGDATKVLKPHDLLGSFMLSDLVTFGDDFLQFVEFVKRKIGGFEGIVGAGAFIH